MAGSLPEARMTGGAWVRLLARDGVPVATAGGGHRLIANTLRVPVRSTAVAATEAADGASSSVRSTPA
ncbi:hypothetical protein [Streptomyces sp. NPDC058398]|uniref:hypothetical protein n=1 Tax=Streptomyces sp. NPDC058398 TaxID=3346479 RepID=UPI0036658B5D